jgi:phosphohistidine phosphatase
MKTIILIRHAKSDWDIIGQADEERTLNERGKKDAPEMAKRLKEKGVKIDLFISSPAKRARKTAKYFAEEFGVKKEDIKLVDELYLASPSAFLKTILHLDDKHKTAALFAHNPGITEFASSLTNVHIDNMPTCAVFAVSANVEKWLEFQNTEKQFVFFDYPKNPLP